MLFFSGRFCLFLRPVFKKGHFSCLLSNAPCKNRKFSGLLHNKLCKIKIEDKRSDFSEERCTHCVLKRLRAFQGKMLSLQLFLKKWL